MQSYQDDHFEALELALEKIYIFLSLLALQKRLNCDEMYILEIVAPAMAQVHPGRDVPLHRRDALEA
jgi:hypothetical protein